MQIDELINTIRDAGVTEIDDLFDAVVQRRRILYPDWDIIYYAQKKGDPVDVDRILGLISKT